MLASASKRRQELLQAKNVVFDIVAPNVDEHIENGIPLTQAIEKLAWTKARQVYQQYPDAIVIGADTVVVCEEEILGKPNNRQEVIDMLEKLSNKTHSVITGVCIIDQGYPHIFHEITKVTFVALSKQQIEQYADTDEPYDKAGSYAIQGSAAKFVKSYEGDYDNVVGLPVMKVLEHLQKIL